MFLGNAISNKTKLLFFLKIPHRRCKYIVNHLWPPKARLLKAFAKKCASLKKYLKVSAVIT